jgi:anhydro-N-acetylmuramic acid kinase
MLEMRKQILIRKDITTNDLLATLTRFSAESIAEAILYTVENTATLIENFTIYLSGGAQSIINKMVKRIIAPPFFETDDLGFRDAKGSHSICHFQ